MLILTNAGTDKLQVDTSSASNLDVSVHWVDLIVGTSSTPGRTNTAIASAANDQDILATPAASTIRIVKHINIRNKHATLSCDVTVVYDQNATDYELHKATLLAGEVLEYQEGIGWFTVQTTRKEDFRRRVTSDVALTNVTPTFADVTGLTCPVASGKHYNFLAHLYHFSSGTTIGARFAINGPTMTALRIQGTDVILGSVTADTTASNVADVTALDTAVIAESTGAATTPVLAVVSGWINPSAAGTFAMRGCVDATGTLTIKTGSWLHLFETDN